MSVLAWGKPNIYTREEGGKGAWYKWPDAVENSTTLDPTKGEKTEAKVEGGANEDVRIKANNYVFNTTIRGAKGRKKPLSDKDGVSIKNYEIYVQPEDPECYGIHIKRSSLSMLPSYNTADGVNWAYAFEVLKPEEGEQVEIGVVTVSEQGVPSIVPVSSEEDA